MKKLIRPLAVAALPLALAACGSMGMMGMSAPDVPAAIAVPSGNKPAFTLKGSGLLTYECRASAGSSAAPDWTLAAPDAVLRDKDNAIVGKYSAGPTWEHGDGSKVTGKQLAVSPAPTAGNIPWQLVQANSASGSGVMNGVTYVQRINTNAGTAPSDSCNASVAGTKKQVRYSADYVFYKS